MHLEVEVVFLFVTSFSVSSSVRRYMNVWQGKKTVSRVVALFYSLELTAPFSKGLFALHRKIWFGVYKKIENFVITNFFVFVIAFALETC